ncbi:MAG: ergot alkaloid biosynthesis protein [Nannocystaceae bacterium]|nr:ergot alkaloid biosynthesis protein [Nannocystaceae bacterium]
MSGPVLVTGATGKTGRRVCRHLEVAGRSVRRGSRSAPVPFDWFDKATHASAVDGVSAGYLVAPFGPTELLPVMRPLIDQLLGQDVDRIVLLSAASLERGGPLMGEVHEYLATHAPRWAVLRPSWFMQNLSEAQHLTPIREQGQLVSATASGRAGWIDAEDIAAVACASLLDRSSPNGELLLTGPQALSYDEVAASIGQARGRAVEHVRISEEDLAAQFESAGMSAAYAKVLASMDEDIAQGRHDFVTDTVPRILGRPARSLDRFVLEHAAAWR